MMGTIVPKSIKLSASLDHPSDPSYWAKPDTYRHAIAPRYRPHAKKTHLNTIAQLHCPWDYMHTERHSSCSPLLVPLVVTQWSPCEPSSVPCLLQAHAGQQHAADWQSLQGLHHLVDDAVLGGMQPRRLPAAPTSRPLSHGADHERLRIRLSASGRLCRCTAAKAGQLP